MNQAQRNNKTFPFSCLNLFGVMIFAAGLALAPQPAFAQHGGGGGGGHSGGGGGGHSGGGHSSGGSHGKSSAAPPAGAYAHGAPSSSTPAKPESGNSAFSTGSRVWGGSELGSSAKAAQNERFAASNNIWQDPPASRSAAPDGQVLRVGPNTFYASSGRSVENPAALSVRDSFSPARTANMPHSLLAPRTNGPFTEMRPEARHFFGPEFGRRFHRPISFNGCFGGFFPGFCGGGYFLGPSLFWGCDPFFWGWSGCGLNYGYGYGYGGDIGYDYNYNYNYDNGYNDSSGGPGMNLQAQPMGIPPEDENFIWQDAPSGSGGQAAPAPRVVTMLYFKDGSSYGVTDYWLAEGSLHYVTSYGGENSVRADLLDLQRTVDENAKNGVNFVLRPATPANPRP